MWAFGDCLSLVLIFVSLVVYGWGFKILVWGFDEPVEVPPYDSLASKGLIVTERVAKSDPAINVSMVGSGDDAVYRVERSAGRAAFYVDYPANSSNLDVRVDDGSGLRVDRVKVVYRNRFGIKRAEYHRLYIGS